MTTKRIKIPDGVSLPVRICEVHISTGETIEKGQAIYTLQGADGKKGIMRSPVAGEVVEGPVELDVQFDQRMPVIGLREGPRPQNDPAASKGPEPEPIKRLRPPAKVALPVRIDEVHVEQGQLLEKGQAIYTLEDADGKKGVMRAPFSGEVVEGPVEAGAQFAQKMPVIGLRPVQESQETAKPAETATAHPEPQSDTASETPDVAAAPSTPPASNAETTPETTEPTVDDLTRDLSEVLAGLGRTNAPATQEVFNATVVRELMLKGHSDVDITIALLGSDVKERWQEIEAERKAVRQEHKRTYWGLRYLGGYAVTVCLSIVLGMLIVMAVQRRLTMSGGRSSP